MKDELRRMAMIGSGVAELTKHRAEQIVKDLVKAGDLRSGNAKTVVKELMERSKANRKEILGFVRSEIKNQIESLGLAGKRDIERLERRVARLEEERKARSSVTNAQPKLAPETKGPVGAKSKKASPPKAAKSGSSTAKKPSASTKKSTSKKGASKTGAVATGSTKGASSNGGSSQTPPA